MQKESLAINPKPLAISQKPLAKISFFGKAYLTFAYCLLPIAFSFSLTPGPILEYFIEIGSDLIRPELYIKAVLPMGGTP